MERGYSIYRSPVGNIEITSRGDAVTGLNFFDVESTDIERITEPIRVCARELDGYFCGDLKNFSVTFHQEGTMFRMRVWEALCKIPYGETISYKTLAEMIGNVNAVRAVGGANHHNNISIIVPCHRVIGSDKSPVGYGGGVWRKEWLLAHEKKSLSQV